MLQTLGVVDVHALAGHPLAARRLGSCSLLEWVVRRVSESQLLDKVVVALDDHPEHRRVARLLPPHVDLVSKLGEDSLGFLTKLASDHKAQAVVRLDVAFPFVDPVYVDRLVTTACGVNNCDYISYCRSSSRGTVHAQLGVFGEWCRASALERADQMAREPVDRVDPLHFVRAHPEHFGLRLIPVPAEVDREDVRLTIDVVDDWSRTELMFDALGPDALDWKRVTGLLERQPEMRQEMARLNQSQA